MDMPIYDFRKTLRVFQMPVFLQFIPCSAYLNRVPQPSSNQEKNIIYAWLTKSSLQGPRTTHKIKSPSTTNDSQNQVSKVHERLTKSSLQGPRTTHKIKSPRTTNDSQNQVSKDHERLTKSSLQGPRTTHKIKSPSTTNDSQNQVSKYHERLTKSSLQGPRTTHKIESPSTTNDSQNQVSKYHERLTKSSLQVPRTTHKIKSPMTSRKYLSHVASITWTVDWIHNTTALWLGENFDRVNVEHMSHLSTFFLLWHDGVIKWKHFPRYWAFVRGIHRTLVNSPHKGQWRGALTFSLNCIWINGCENNRNAGDLRRYRTHYDVIVVTQWRQLTE